MLTINEHKSPSYAPRTYHNAASADITVAFAIDFNTAGEKVTHKAAGDKYIGISLNEEPIVAARRLYKAMRDNNARVLNVAGNGIYTLSKKGWSQDRLDQHLMTIVGKVFEFWPIEKIISGGQTGVDISGIIVAQTLGIDAVATLPKGFIQRGTNKVDVTQTKADIVKQIEMGVAKLNDAFNIDHDNDDRGGLK